MSATKMKPLVSVDGAAFEPPPLVLPPPAVEPSPPPTPAPRTERFYRVTAEARVPRGASHYTLPAGKVISSRTYAVEQLRSIGVPLEEVPDGDNPQRATIVK